MRMRPRGRIATAVLAAAWLAACTPVVDSVVESRYGQYNHSSEWAQNEATLLNILRAGNYQPLNFVTFQPYQGTASVSAAAAAPAFTIGPYLTPTEKQYAISNNTLNASATAGGTIGVTILNTHDFYTALLSPVEFIDLYTFQRQGYPRQLLFRLFTDYVSLRPSGDPQGHYASIIYNDPSTQRRCATVPDAIPDRLYPNLPPNRRPRQICFEDLVGFALLSGLSSEVRNAPSGSKPSAQKKSKNDAGASGDSKSDSASAAQPPSVEGRLCFDGALANRAMQEEAAAHPERTEFLAAVRTAQYYPVCGGPWTDAPRKGAASGSSPSPGVETLSVHVRRLTGQLVWDIHSVQNDTVEIGTRSTFSIYNYLGQLLHAQEPDITNLMRPPEDGEDPRILVVNKGQPLGCFVSAVFELDIYCVPADGAENTKRTFSLLAQLLALKTTNNDLQLLPTIRLLPTN